MAEIKKVEICLYLGSNGHESRKREVDIMSLERFHTAQQDSFEQALKEIKNGKKCSCWMWYIFPQLKGLGTSNVAQYYGIADLQEARDYMADSVLGTRLLTISEALLELKTDNADEVFGYPDNLKLKSSMTLFSVAVPEQDVFDKVLQKFFHAERDERTLKRIE